MQSVHCMKLKQKEMCVSFSDDIQSQKNIVLTSVMSLLAAAADMCKEGCFIELEQSKARANVPTDLDTTKN